MKGIRRFLHRIPKPLRIFFDLLLAALLFFAWFVARGGPRFGEEERVRRAEKANLAFSGRLITLTIGIRFLTDYLAGDVYFHTTCPDHNLVRCRTQFKRVESMEAQAADYEGIVRQVASAR